MHRKQFFLSLILFLMQPYCWAMEPNTFIAFIDGFNVPVNLAVTPNGLYAYVSDAGSNSVLVIDVNPSSPTFNTLIAAPNLSGVFNNPAGIAITPTSNFVYVCNANANTVSVIQTSDNTVVATINGFNGPGSIAITPNGLYAYVMDSGSNSVSVIDLNPLSPTYNTILVTPGLDGILNSPFSITITPSGLYAYVCNLAGSVTAIDLNPSSPTYNTALVTPGLDAVNPQPEGLGITANSLVAYVCDGSDSAVTVLDINPASPTFNTVVSAPNLSAAFNFPNGVANTPNGNYAYVTNFIGASANNSSVSVIDTNPLSPTYNSTLNTPGLTLPFLTRFLALTITPNGMFVYAADGFNNTVDVIYTGVVGAPSNFVAVKIENIFLLETNWVNRLTWSAPALGVAPVAYAIYRDPGLTQLIATVPATVLQYYDANQLPNVVTTYYIVSVDSSGNISTPTSATTY